MKVVKIKDISINRGKAKICVPIVSTREREILNDFNALRSLGPDLVEFRADYFQDIQDPLKVLDLLDKIRLLYEGPLIFTLRTKKEGGVTEISPEYYFHLNSKVLKSGLIDLIDIEFSSQIDNFYKTIDLANEKKVATIVSSHKIVDTPTEDQIITRVDKMIEYGDIGKIAVMPNSEEDVLTLLSASLQLKKEKKGPFIAIAMGPLGTISRISCNLFGSCITYASYKGQSAPGQLNLKLTKEILKVMD